MYVRLDCGCKYVRVGLKSIHYAAHLHALLTGSSSGEATGYMSDASCIVF